MTFALVVKKVWVREVKSPLNKHRTWKTQPMEGWYLFGFFPLYVRARGLLKFVGT